MKVVSLKADGFRSLLNLWWKPEDFSIITGPAGSGKTDLIQLLQLASCSARGKLREYFLDAGGIFHNSRDGERPEILVSITIPAGSDVRGERTERISYTLQLFSEKNSGYFIGNEYLHTYYAWNDRAQYIKEIHNNYIVRDGEKVEILETPVEKPGVYSGETPGMQHISADPGDFSRWETVLSLQNLSPSTHDFLRHFRLYLSSWDVFSRVPVGEDSFLRKPVIRDEVKTLDCRWTNVIPVLHQRYLNDSGFREALDDALGISIGGDFAGLGFFGERGMEVGIKLHSRDDLQTFREISDEILGFLFFFTVFRTCKEGSLVAVDDFGIDTGGHLLRVLFREASEASRRTQVILMVDPSRVSPDLFPANATVFHLTRQDSSIHIV